jgi:Sulfite exporter TauE/SafE
MIAAAMHSKTDLLNGIAPLRPLTCPARNGSGGWWIAEIRPETRSVHRSRTVRARSLSGILLWPAVAGLNVARTGLKGRKIVGNIASVTSLSTLGLIFFMLVMVGAFTVRSAAGFGAVLIAMPMLAFVMPVSTAASVTTVLTAITSMHQVTRDWHRVAWRHFAIMAFYSAIGIGLGFYFIKLLDERALRHGLGVFLIFYSLYAVATSKVSRTIPARWRNALAAFSVSWLRSRSSSIRSRSRRSRRRAKGGSNGGTKRWIAINLRKATTVRRKLPPPHRGESLRDTTERLPKTLETCTGNHGSTMTQAMTRSAPNFRSSGRRGGSSSRGSSSPSSAATGRFQSDCASKCGLLRGGRKR